MRRGWLVVGLLVLAAIGGSACDGIGRPLVGKRAVLDTRDKKSLCVLAPSCSDDVVDDLASMIQPIDLAPVDLRACGGELRGCEVEVDPFDGHRTSRGCAVTWDASELTAQAADQTFDCVAASLTVDRELPQPITLDRAELRGVSLTLATDRPVVLLLENSSFSDVHILLDGPVTLRVSRPRAFKQVRIVASANTQGEDEPRIELANLDADDVSIANAVAARVYTEGEPEHLDAENVSSAGDDGQFPGTVAIESGALRSARIKARRIEITDAALEYSSLGSDALDTSNANLSYATLAFLEGKLSGSTIERTEVTECGSLSVVTGMLTYVRIPACAAPLRVYGASIAASFIDGAVEGDHALFQTIVFGAHTTTDLLAWDSQIYTSNFCAHASTVRLGASLLVICPSCDPDHRLITCADSKAIRRIETGQCDAFVDPLECGSALPQRPQPPR